MKKEKSRIGYNPPPDFPPPTRIPPYTPPNKTISMEVRLK